MGKKKKKKIIENPCNGMNYKFTTTIRVNLKCILVKGKKSDPKDYIYVIAFI